MYNHASHTKVAYEVGGLASIPGQVPGLSNIPLNGSAGQTPVGNADAVGASATNTAVGVSSETALYYLDLVSKAKTNEEVQALKPHIAKAREQIKTPEFVEMFKTLERAMDINGDPRKQTQDPVDGNPEPLAQDIAKDIIGRVDSYMVDTQSNANGQIISGDSNTPRLAVAAETKQDKDEDDTSKKKTRGNPFRVLMGQVGKLLDHGMHKRDIVKYILRQSIWNEETINKAVEVVKDYNRKKKRKNVSSCFNLARYSQLIDNNESKLSNTLPFGQQSDPSVLNGSLTPDWKKRSTAELFARASWLNSLKGWDANPRRETKKAADTTGATNQLREIRSELKRRGFTAEELP